MPDAVRKQANKYIHQIATNKNDTEAVKACVNLIGALGLNRLANTLEKALAEVKIEESGNKLWIEAPYLNGQATPDWRRIPGRIFDRDTKRNVVPSEKRVEVFNLLKKHYPGLTALGPKGLFKL